MAQKLKKVVVVGGGISGLTTAWILSRDRGNLVTLLESKSQLGGCIQTDFVGDYLVEWGPNGFLVNQGYVWNLIHEVGLGDELVPGSSVAGKNRFLWKSGKLNKLPSSLVGFLLNPVLTIGGRLRVLFEPFIPGKPNSRDESIRDFAMRRLGKEATDTLLDPFVAGIHAGDPYTLSARTGFPRLTALESRYGSIILGMLMGGLGKPRLVKGTNNPKRSRIWSLRKGLGQLVERLAEGISTLHKDCPVSSIERRPNRSWRVETALGPLEADALVLACSPHASAAILARVDPRGASLLAEMKSNSLAVVVFAFDRGQVSHLLDGFGYLIPSGENRDILGVQWCSSIYPGRAPEGKLLLRVLMGGTRRPELALLPKEKLEQLAFENIARDLGVSGKPIWVETQIWNPAIPQYQLGHEDLVKEIGTIESRWGSLFLTGNGLGGVSLNDCVRQAEDCARRVQDMPSRT
jgi:oxygen-dependent protoporphyrinogen oxidase